MFAPVISPLENFYEFLDVFMISHQVLKFIIYLYICRVLASNPMGVYHYHFEVLKKLKLKKSIQNCLN